MHLLVLLHHITNFPGVLFMRRHYCWSFFSLIQGFYSFYFCFFFFLVLVYLETQSQRQCPEQNTRKCLSVKVGSIKCMVESQYISNHDFLEVIINDYLLASPLVFIVFLLVLKLLVSVSF